MAKFRGKDIVFAIKGGEGSYPSSDISHKLIDKRLCILGDSISTFGTPDKNNATGTWTYKGNRCRYPQDDLFTDVNYMYWKKLLDKTGMVFGVNESWAGSRVSNTASSDSGDLGPNRCISSWTRISHLREKGVPDIIIVYGGTNDIAGATIGTFDATKPITLTSGATIANPSTLTRDQLQNELDVSTFGKAYPAMLARLQHLYPDALIICLTPNYCKTHYGSDYTKMNEAVTIVKNCCDYFGVPYIDLRKAGIGLMEMSSSTSTSYLPDGIHPGIKGHQYIFEYIYNFIMSSYFVSGSNIDPNPDPDPDPEPEIPVTGVTLNKKSATLKANETLQLTATVEPSDATNKEVHWRSNDGMVASVSRTGLVMGLRKGQTTIEVISDGDSSKRDECSVNVTEQEIDPPTNQWYLNNTIEYKGHATTSVNIIGGGWHDTLFERALYKVVNRIRFVLDSAHPDITSGKITISKASNLNASSIELIEEIDFSNPNTKYKIKDGLVTFKTKDFALTGTEKLVIDVENVYFKFAQSQMWAGDIYLRIPTPKPNAGENAWTKNSRCSIMFDLGYNDNDSDLEPDIIPVEDIIVMPSMTTIEVGEKLQLTATVEPSDATNKEIVWTSENDSIATVTQTGLVTGVGAGSIKIKAQTTNNEPNQVEGWCDLTVKEAVKYRYRWYGEEALLETNKSPVVLQGGGWTSPNFYSGNRGLFNVLRMRINTTQSYIGKHIKILDCKEWGSTDPNKVPVVVNMELTEGNTILEGDILIILLDKIYSMGTPVLDTEDLSFYYYTGVEAEFYSRIPIAKDGVTPWRYLPNYALGIDLGYRQIDTGEVEVESVTVTPESAIMYVGDKLQLRATVKPDGATYDKIQWFGYNDEGSIEVTDTGLVTASTAGKARVEARVGYSIVTMKNAYCNLTIEEKYKFTWFGEEANSDGRFYIVNLSSGGWLSEGWKSDVTFNALRMRVANPEDYIGKHIKIMDCQVYGSSDASYFPTMVDMELTESNTILQDNNLLIILLNESIHCSYVVFDTEDLAFLYWGSSNPKKFLSQIPNPRNGAEFGWLPNNNFTLGIDLGTWERTSELSNLITADNKYLVTLDNKIINSGD